MASFKKPLLSRTQYTAAHATPDEGGAEGSLGVTLKARWAWFSTCSFVWQTNEHSAARRILQTSNDVLPNAFRTATTLALDNNAIILFSRFTLKHRWSSI